MPGHLIAVLVILGVEAFVVPYAACMPLLLLAALLSAPLLGVALLSLGSMAAWGWFAWLVFGLATRRAPALRHSRVTAAILCGIGGACLLGGAMIGPTSPFGQLWAAMSFTGDLVVQVACGLYLLWALGRADVRAWLAGAAAPLASRPSGPQ